MCHFEGWSSKASNRQVFFINSLSNLSLWAMSSKIPNNSLSNLSRWSHELQSKKSIIFFNKSWLNLSLWSLAFKSSKSTRAIWLSLVKLTFVQCQKAYKIQRICCPSFRLSYACQCFNVMGCQWLLPIPPWPTTTTATLTCYYYCCYYDYHSYCDCCYYWHRHHWYY